MTHYSHTNPNPREKNVGDCTVRAISLANEQSWEDTYLDLCIKGYMLADMPSSNEVWSSYLIDKGWEYHRLQDSCPFCYTIENFSTDHPQGTYIVATGTHVVCVKNGTYLDAWDSGDKVPLFYFSKKE